MKTTKKIQFTNEALKQIEKIVLENGPKKYFRISVQGGGCSGFKCLPPLTTVWIGEFERGLIVITLSKQPSQPANATNHRKKPLPSLKKVINNEACSSNSCTGYLYAWWYK